MTSETTPVAIARIDRVALGTGRLERPREFYGGPLRLPRTVRRLEASPAWACWAGTAPALELLADLGLEAIRAHDLALAQRLRDGLGLEPYPSAIVVIDRPGAEDALIQAGVRASTRAGRVRLSCHLPATATDVELATTALSDAA